MPMSLRLKQATTGDREEGPSHRCTKAKENLGKSEKIPRQSGNAGATEITKLQNAPITAVCLSAMRPSTILVDFGASCLKQCFGGRFLFFGGFLNASCGSKTHSLQLNVWWYDIIAYARTAFLVVHSAQTARQWAITRAHGLVTF